MDVNFEKAEKKALEILEYYNIDKPPIVPYKIASDEGLNIILAKFSSEYRDKVSGFLDVNSDSPKIYVNDDDPINRQTFTIAHELGHWILHKEKIKNDPALYSVLLRSSLFKEENSNLEKEANFFAANLLIPKKIIKEYIKITKDLSILGKIFCVSIQFMKFRLDYLGYKYEN
jgi:Zn-dependent peptidase ImmA (M78 family)